MAGAGIVVGTRGVRQAGLPKQDPPVVGDGYGSKNVEAGLPARLERTPGDTAWGWLPPPAASPGSLLVVDASPLTSGQRVALAILQGLVNSRLADGGQAVYLLIPIMPNCFTEQVFNRWPEVYSGRRAIASESGTPQDVVELAVERGVEQYVIWDPSVPATINVATTLAWLRGTAAFGPADAGGSLTEGLTVALDLRAFNFASSADAYRWALDQTASPSASTLALVSVGDLPGDPSEGVVNWTVRDYSVGARAFTGPLTCGT